MRLIVVGAYNYCDFHLNSVGDCDSINLTVIRHSAKGVERLFLPHKLPIIDLLQTHFSIIARTPLS